MKSITAAELSRRSGVSKQTISSWMSGERPRDVRKVKAVADVFNTTIDNLLYGNGNNSPLKQTQKNVAPPSLGQQEETLNGVFQVEIKMVRK